MFTEIVLLKIEFSIRYLCLSLRIELRSAKALFYVVTRKKGHLAICPSTSLPLSVGNCSESYATGF